MKTLLLAIREAMQGPAGGEWWPLRKLADDYGIFHDDLDGPRLIPLLIDKVLKH